MCKQLLLIDLDGTLYNGNTFHVWIRFMLQHSFSLKNPLFRVLCFCRICYYSILRKTHRISHSRFKFLIQHSWNLYFAYNEAFISAFIAKLKCNIREDLIERIQKSSERGDAILLTTAAPEEYVKPLVESINGIEDFLSTPKSTANIWFDNIRDEKCSQTVSFIEDRGLTNGTKILYTDHIDDEPLLKISNKAFLFEPLNKSISELKVCYPDIEIISFYG